MGKEIYDRKTLLNVHTKETQTWIGKLAIVKLVDDSIIEGVIKEVGYAANINKDDDVVEHLWVNLLIDDKRLSVTKIKFIEI